MTPQDDTTATVPAQEAGAGTDARPTLQDVLGGDEQEAAAGRDDLTATTPDDFPSYSDRPRPEGWTVYTDAEKRAYVNSGVEPDPDAEPVEPQTLQEAAKALVDGWDSANLDERATLMHGLALHTQDDDEPADEPATVEG